MESLLNNFHKQFLFVPEIVNSFKLKRGNKFLFLGMGGSHLAADLLKISHPHLNIIVHSNFHLPYIDDLKERNIILISYSGNTLETIISYNELKSKKLNFLIVSANGYLLDQAKKFNLSYIEIPEKNLPPRLAVGYLYLALIKIIDDKKSFEKIKEVSQKIKISSIKQKALKLVLNFKNRIPIIYSSFQNYPLAYNFKIRFNETSKIPAFCHYFPELNHNEIQGYYFFSRFKNKFIFLFLKDKNDSLLLQKSIKTSENILIKKGYRIESISLPSENVYLKIFSSIHLADWLSYYLAEMYKVDPISVPFIEEIKKMIRKK